MSLPKIIYYEAHKSYTDTQKREEEAQISAQLSEWQKVIQRTSLRKFRKENLKAFWEEKPWTHHPSGHENSQQYA